MLNETISGPFIMHDWIQKSCQGIQQYKINQISNAIEIKFLWTIPICNLPVKLLKQRSQVKFQLRKEQDQYEVIDQKPYRKIFENVKYNDEQLKKIDRVKQYLRQKQPNKIYQDAFVLKMIYLTSGTFNPLSVCESIKKHQEWFQNPSIATNRNQGRKILQEGVFYSYGRDLQYSPIIYIYPCQLDTSKYSIIDYFNALFMLLDPIQQYMLIPGINETLNIVIDMQNKNFPLPTSSLKEMIEKTVFAYPYRLKRLFFIHSNPGNDLVKSLKQTLKFFNYQVKPQFIIKMEQFRKYIPDEQRQQKYGGNLQNLNQFWPISLATKYEQQKSYFLIENASQTDYKSIVNEETYFQGIQSNQSMCGNCGKKACQIY